MTDLELMKWACSLGESCELGVAQRKVGAEPLDLLRWANTSPSNLVAMIEDRFRDIGDPNLIVVQRRPKEFLASHKKYGIRWHAFGKIEETDDFVHAREAKRLPRLAEKLMDEMSDRSRLFVVRLLRGDDHIFERISKAMSAYGTPTLLCVTQGPDDRVVGDSSFLKGQIPSFSDPARVPGTTDTASWVRLIRAAFMVVAK